MRPLLSATQSLELDAFTRKMFEFSSDHLMEIASMRLWERLKREVIQNGILQSTTADSRIFKKEISIAALCGKGDNAGDALAMLRHAKLDGFQKLTAFIPAPDTLKEGAQMNLRRAERCGIDIFRTDNTDEATILAKLSNHTIVLDAILGTGVRGPARGGAARMLQILKSMQENRAPRAEKTPYIVAIDIPSGLGDDWRPGYPVAHADTTLCIEPMKEALYIPAARPFSGDILPVEDVFPLWVEAASKGVKLLEDDDVWDYLPPISQWAHKMQRGKIAILAGSASGAGAALHCVRGAAAAGAGYIALYCDEPLYSSYLSAVGDTAIVRLLSEKTLSPEDWDAIVVGPGWGVDTTREEILERLLQSNTALILDADAIRLFARIAGRHSDTLRFYSAPVILTPHPGEFRELITAQRKEKQPEADVSEAVEQLTAFAKKFGSIVALRASTTHVAFTDGSCAIYDGSASGLGIAGSGDVLSGLAGGLLSRWIAFSREKELTSLPVDTALWQSNLEKAIIGAVLVHGAAGRRLSREKGWFTPGELAQACIRITSHHNETK